MTSSASITIERKLRTLKKGESPIFEPGLTDLLKKNIAEKRLTFTTDLEAAVKKTDVIFLALPTPQAEDGSADLQHVLAVAKRLGKAMNGYKVIVNKSTVPVGTADKVREIIASETKHEFDVVSNPEFLKEGAAVNDFMKPDRIVVGSSSQKAIAIMQDLYAPFVRTGNPMIVMDEHSSELTKYAANSFLATKVTFMNEIANLCERVGADVDMVRKGMGTDARIGQQFLFAGVGYGGSCFPKDVSALSEHLAGARVRPFTILDAVEHVNRRQKLVIVEKIKKHFGAGLKGKTLAAVGPGVQAEHGRHARGARAHDHQRAARSWASTSGRSTPWRWRRRRSSSAKSDQVCDQQLRGAEGRRATDRGDGVERVPPSRFRPDEGRC